MGVVRRCGLLVGTVGLLVFLDALLELFVDGLVAVQVFAERVAEEVLQGLAAGHLHVEVAGVALLKLVDGLLEAEGVGDDAGEQDRVEYVLRPEGFGGLECLHDVGGTGRGRHDHEV